MIVIDLYIDRIRIYTLKILDFGLRDRPYEFFDNQITKNIISIFSRCKQR